MAKTINVKYQDKEYVLEFTRKSIEKLENTGFKVSDIDSKPISTLPRLFYGAFLAHHPYIKKDLTDEIFSNMPNKEDLLGKLAEMYSEPITALVEDPEVNEGNASWGASW